MDNAIDELAEALCVTAGVVVVVITGVVVYAGWLVLRLATRARGLKPPQVARDGTGRRLKERI